MTTTELIELLQRVEFGGSGKPREISFSVEGGLIPNPTIKVDSTGDGIAGTELCLKIDGEVWKTNEDN